MDKIVIATKNDGKAQEYRNLFKPLGISVVTLKDLDDKTPINENGTTFEENALIKAQTINNVYHLPVLADDSGLEVDYLNGAPGIHSARYAKDHDDAANRKKLLHNLSGVPTNKRTAHFHTTIVVVDEGKQPLIANGEVYGRILEHETGEHGFGYDSLFYYEPFDASFAQVELSEKNKVSHRANAVKNLMENFESWWNKSTTPV